MEGPHAAGGGFFRITKSSIVLARFAGFASPPAARTFFGWPVNMSMMSMMSKKQPRTRAPPPTPTITKKQNSTPADKAIVRPTSEWREK